MKYAKSIIGGFIGIVVIFLIFSSVTTVQSGYRGVLLQLGAVKPTILSEGFHFKIPFIQSVQPIEVRVQKEESAQTAASKDLQTVTTTVAVNYSVDPEAVNKLYQNIGLDYRSRIVDPAIAESLKAVTAKYTAEELISKRPEVSAEVKDMLKVKLTKYYMKLEDINIKEFAFSEEFNKAIEAKQTAEQNALKAQRDLDRIKIEAQQQIAQAGAEAEALKLKKQEVTPELIQLKQIEVQEKALEKWDGHLPSVTSGATPFIDVNGLSGK
ncbi:prohibitin family protein [Neobacillus ginsengisoli]|uniref:Regulator of protease activity HflC (Stomatin/prohibitin superfamily) n=1 Tax=Neobacillus ginsengisoli TaxID=904295 RepID=A0ABT9XUN4_9BACI|nr:prohibitin family protein [Neobacillus ginsengisoli]MDQ0199211.1 regulator of protease activity HflC (stomatin/prohibitin superfamily) [Neobacillus ginsengisoli]